MTQVPNIGLNCDRERELRPCFAHTLPDRPSTEWEPLEDHLERVSQLAGEFASAFDAAEWGKILGRCHDLGKYSEEFQNYIRCTSDPNAGVSENQPGRVDHSTFGARFIAHAVGGHRGQLLAFCVAGHHAGLPDFSSDEETGQRRTLQWKLNPNRYRIPDVSLPERDPEVLKLAFDIQQNGNPGFQAAFFARMLFSCLIDGDRTATEEFCDLQKAQERARSRPCVAQLKCHFDCFLLEKQSQVEGTPVNLVRSEVQTLCREAAKLRPGFFSLNVPTGGGKTYSSLAFALDHAQGCGLRRVIVAVPFTTITEQTTEAYRLALGSLAQSGLIEHHTNINAKHDIRSNQLGSENWDAPHCHHECTVFRDFVCFRYDSMPKITSSSRECHRVGRGSNNPC